MSHNIYVKIFFPNFSVKWQYIKTANSILWLKDGILIRRKRSSINDVIHFILIFFDFLSYSTTTNAYLMSSQNCWSLQLRNLWTTPKLLIEGGVESGRYSQGLETLAPDWRHFGRSHPTIIFLTQNVFFFWIHFQSGFNWNPD